MMKKMRFGLVAAAAIVGMLSATMYAPTAQAVPVGDAAFKCELGLWKGFKASLFVEKFVGKCAIDYHKRKLFLLGQKGKDASAIDKSGELCEKFVGDKGLAILSSTPVDAGNCDAGNRAALGIPENWAAGDVQALLTVNALRDGLAQAMHAAPDLWQIMEAVGTTTADTGEITDPGSTCDSCEGLRLAFGTAFGPEGVKNGAGPCQNYTCGISRRGSCSGSGDPCSVNTDCPSPQTCDGGTPQGGQIGVATDLLAPVVIGVPTSGTLNLDVCQYDPVTGDDFFVYSGPARTIKASITGVADVCVVSTATRGFITSAGSGRQMGDFETCQDHMAANGTCSTTTSVVCGADTDCPATETCSGNTENDDCVDTESYTGDECAAPALEGNCSSTTSTVCQTDSDCPSAETCVETLVTGGACFRATNTSGGGAGDASISTTLFNTIVTDAGLDTVPCTADDNADPAAPTPITLTTRDATGIIYDVDRNDGLSFSPPTVSGSAFTMTGANSLESGSLSGKLVTVFPTLSLDLSALLGPGSFADGIISAELVCQKP